MLRLSHSARCAALTIVAAIAASTWASPSDAQVNDAERAAARELFKQGDELQRAGRFRDALDRFERAQQVFSAPTNELRIAECQAALGRLVESTEAFRTVVRTPLAPSSPPAFQAAIEQARAELEQVEPRVPKVVVQVQPASAGRIQWQIDGQSVPAALIGEAVPLDPGQHRIALNAAGFAGIDQSMVLKERETRALVFTLQPEAPSPTPVSPVPAPPPPPPAVGDAPRPLPPPPPVVTDEEAGGGTRGSRIGLLFGVHVGGTGVGGRVPQGNGTIDASEVASAGVSGGIDATFRFGRVWSVGLTVDHASFPDGSRQSDAAFSGVGDIGAEATLVGVVFGFRTNPDKTSFYGELGLGARWFGYNSLAGQKTYTGGDFSIGAGVWIPLGRSFRLLPKATLGGGTFSVDNASSSDSANPGHAFFTLGLAGAYNIDIR